MKIFMGIVYGITFVGFWALVQTLMIMVLCDHYHVTETLTMRSAVIAFCFFPMSLHARLIKKEWL